MNLANQTEGFTISSGGFFGTASITASSGNDTIRILGGNYSLLDGGANTDELNVNVNFTSNSDAQIANIENVLLTSDVTLNLANQTESFIITGSAGNDSITGGLGADIISSGSDNDTIAGAQNDTLLDGGADTDQLNVGADFTSTSDAQIVNIENVLLTSAVTLSLANQTEGVTIAGSSGIDSITAGSGGDIIFGASDDSLLDGNLGITVVCRWPISPRLAMLRLRMLKTFS